MPHQEATSMIAKLALLLVCVTLASGNPAAGKPWHWKSPQPLVTPVGPVKSPRIIGGTEAKPHSWPHQVALLTDSGLFCGGSLISNEWVLTAAHCVDSAKAVVVFMGAHNLTRRDEPTQVITSSADFNYHEDWNVTLAQNDIAVIRLPSPVTFNENIRAISLPSADLQVGDLVTTTGWGLRSSGKQTDVLRQVTVPVISKEDCNKDASEGAAITDGMVCTDSASGRGTCFGDSGGPLTANKNLYGITSFVINRHPHSCEDGLPDVFTRVYHYLDWIKSKTGITP